MLEVLVSQGRIKLCTENATYSYEDLYSVFKKGFHQINIGQFKIEKVLILGFGLGSIPNLLSNKYNFKSEYTGIEIDPVIIDLNHEFLPENILNQCQLIEADAYEWVQKKQDRFNLIAIDLFIDALTDNKFKSDAFISNTVQHLAKNGMLLFNLLANSKENAKSIQLYFKEVFQPQFKAAKILSIGQNRLLVGNN